ncbi:MAG: alpha/beta hydrolase [Trebonia sp.]
MESMARIGFRLRAWGALTRRQASVARLTDAQVMVLQAREVPDNVVTGWLFGAVVPGTAVRDRVVPGPDGNDIPVRVYRPAAAAPGSRGASAARPLVLYLHGGGFVFGGLRMGDWLCSSVSAGVGAVVVSADYRLAPAHKFPAAVEDSYAALTWAAAHAGELGATGPIGMMGESAGCNLAAVISLLGRDRGGPAITHQALMYPVTDMTDAGTRTPSAPANPDAPFLSAGEITAYRRLYLRADGDTSDPRASPLLAASLAGLPPALIQVGEHDPLRDDGTRYAAALRAAGVPVRLTEYVGVPHGFMNFPGLCRIAAQAMSEICAEQRTALAVE